MDNSSVFYFLVLSLVAKIYFYLTVQSHDIILAGTVRHLILGLIKASSKGNMFWVNKFKGNVKVHPCTGTEVR